jgi:hypothetical protein
MKLIMSFRRKFSNCCSKRVRVVDLAEEDDRLHTNFRISVFLGSKLNLNCGICKSDVNHAVATFSDSAIESYSDPSEPSCMHISEQDVKFCLIDESWRQ